MTDSEAFVRQRNVAIRESQTLDEPAGVLPSNRRMLFFVAFLVILVDHLSKRLIEWWLPLNQTWAPIPSLAPYFRITHVSNTGAAFGLFPGGSSLFTVIAVAVALVIIYYNFRLPGRYSLLRLALGLQLGGAMGNLIDRLRLGHVTDFFDFGPWPVFNLADASIVAGVLLLALLMWKEQAAHPAAPVVPPADPIAQEAYPEGLTPLYLRPNRQPEEEIGD